jgi:hypothetical protein
MKNNDYFCAPGEKLPQEVIDAMGKANDDCRKSGDFPKYERDIAAIFKLKPKNITTDHKLFLGGFVEGEGSISISAKKLANAKFGVIVDPEFSVTQHVNGAAVLYDLMRVFKTGRMRYKSGSNATLVYIIDNRQSIEEKVIPFYEEYVAPYGSHTKEKRLQVFKETIMLLKAGCHQDLDCLADKILPKWSYMRMQTGQANQSFSSLEEAQNFVRHFRRSSL